MDWVASGKPLKDLWKMAFPQQQQQNKHEKEQQNHFALWVEKGVVSGKRVKNFTHFFRQCMYSTQMFLTIKKTSKNSQKKKLRKFCIPCK